VLEGGFFQFCEGGLAGGVLGCVKCYLGRLFLELWVAGMFGGGWLVGFVFICFPVRGGGEDLVWGVVGGLVGFRVSRETVGIFFFKAFF